MDSIELELKKALKKIEQNLEMFGTLSPSDFNHEDISLLYSLAVSLYEREEYSEAKNFFQRLILSRSHEKKFWMGLGACEQMMKSYEDALTRWAFVSFLDSHDPSPHFHAAECYLALDQIEQAHLAANQAKQLAENKSEHKGLLEKIDLLEKKWLILR